MLKEVEESKVQVWDPKTNLNASAFPTRAGKRMQEKPMMNIGKLSAA
jgi:hypothetical protein